MNKDTITTITITTDGHHAVVAHRSDLKGNTETYRDSAALCNPRDTFNYREGVRIALCRLFEENPFSMKEEPSAMEPNLFHLEDIVRITGNGTFPMSKDACRYGTVIGIKAMPSGKWHYTVKMFDGVTITRCEDYLELVERRGELS